MQFHSWLEQRHKGKRLSDSGYVSIYRAVAQNVNEFFPMDYVTLSRKFAKGHAEHQSAVEEEPYIVIKAFVPSKDVYEADNPGEYFYDGSAIKGRVV